MGLFLTACVPARKYEEQKSKAAALQAEVDGATSKSRDVQAAYDELRSTTLQDAKRLTELHRDTTVLGNSLRQMTGQYDKINSLNNELLEKYNKLLAGDRSENRELLTDLEAMRLNLQNKEAEIEAKDAAMKALKDRVSAALTGFEGKGLTVEQRGGRIYVSMDNKLLFPSGSATVDAKGKDAIMKLAKAIENEKDLNILVEGHTDTDKIGSGSTYKDNWDLSVIRATSVVRIMQENSVIDPVRLTATGRGEYIPVDPNDKSKNRRIEVILAPDLTELYKLVTD